MHRTVYVYCLTVYTMHWSFHIYKTIAIKKVYIYLVLNFT